MIRVQDHIFKDVITGTRYIVEIIAFEANLALIFRIKV